jgi:ABC-type nickel/cobalt efflux system permease component RcnA
VVSKGAGFGRIYGDATTAMSTTTMTTIMTGSRGRPACAVSQRWGCRPGVIPCPEALSVLLLAIGPNRTARGMVMIVAFSAGLAAVLVGLGLLLVTSWSPRRRSCRDSATGVQGG